MRGLFLRFAIACITFAFSTHVTKLWNGWTRRPTPPAVVRISNPEREQIVSANDPELLAIYREYAAAQTRHDTAFFERVEAKDFRLFAWGESYSRTEDIQQMSEEDPRTVYKIEDLRIERRGDGAVVRGRMIATEPNGSSESWNWIDVCLQGEHGWQIMSTTQTD